MKILIRSDKDIKKACEEYNTFAMDERLRDMYEARFKRLCDEASALSDAKREGIEQGIEQGIIGMYNAGVSLRLIADSFHWDEQRVQSVLQKHKLI